MNYLYRILLSVLCCFAVNSLQAQTTAVVQTNNHPPPATKVDNIRYFPFTVDEATLSVKVNVRDEKVARYYTPLFQKYLYAGSARTWEGMVEELLAVKDLDFSIRNKINSDTDDDSVVFTASSKEELDYFLKLVQPTFAVIANLEAFIKKVDPKQIDDGSHITPEEY